MVDSSAHPQHMSVLKHLVFMFDMDVLTLQ
jgi:hypothetical protein